MNSKPTGRAAPRPRKGQPVVTSSYSLTADAHVAAEAYAAKHGMSRSAAASALIAYGVAWLQEREKKRKAGSP